MVLYSFLGFLKMYSRWLGWEIGSVEWYHSVFRCVPRLLPSPISLSFPALKISCWSLYIRPKPTPSCLAPVSSPCQPMDIFLFRTLVPSPVAAPGGFTHMKGLPAVLLLWFITSAPVTAAWSSFRLSCVRTVGSETWYSSLISSMQSLSFALEPY
jgi:hypothetical protein